MAQLPQDALPHIDNDAQRLAAVIVATVQALLAIAPFGLQWRP